MPFRKCSMCGREVDAFTLVDHPNPLTNSWSGGICQSCANTVKEQKRQEERYQEEQKRRDRERQEDERRYRERKQAELSERAQRERQQVEFTERAQREGKNRGEINRAEPKILDKKQQSQSDEVLALKSSLKQQMQSILKLGEDVGQIKDLLRFGMRNELEKSSEFCRKLKSIISERTNSFSSKATILVHITSSMEWYYLDTGVLQELFEDDDINFTSVDMKLLARPTDLGGILSTRQDNALFFVRDNADTVSLTPVREMLCQACGIDEIPWVIGQGPSARSIDIPIPSFIYVIISRNEATLDLYAECIKNFNPEITLIRESV